MRQDPYLYVAASVGLTLGAALAAAPAQAQVEAALNVGGKKMEFRGQGQCKAAAQASIYDIPAALYSVSQRSGSQSMNMNLWQPRSGAANMLSLHISDGAKRYEVDTVKGGAKKDTKGSGSATLQKSGAGGTFTIDAKAASGEKITGTIECGRFGGIQAEGG